jgi:hypothetical protein
MSRRELREQPTHPASKGNPLMCCLCWLPHELCLGMRRCWGATPATSEPEWQSNRSAETPLTVDSPEVSSGMPGVSSVPGVGPFFDGSVGFEGALWTPGVVDTRAERAQVSGMSSHPVGVRSGGPVGLGRLLALWDGGR